jgi:ABC-type transport system involved in multi-copper enzyme maturation permease subunit
VFIGPLFAREAVTAPRRPRHFIQRSLYVGALIVLMCTAWLVVAVTQVVQNVGDMARFGAILLQILAPVQLALVTFLSALVATSSVSQEKDRRTLILLLMTRMNNHELVLGKLFASLLNVGFMVTAALPVMLAIILVGGVSVDQVIRVFLVCLLTSLLTGSVGVMIAFWREKTFQTLALTAMVLLVWQGCWLTVGLGALGQHVFGVDHQTLAVALSPINAVMSAAEPSYITNSSIGGWLGAIGPFLASSIGLIVAINGITILRVRIWNPSRELRRMGRSTQSTIDSREDAVDSEDKEQVAEHSRGLHVDGRTREIHRRHRKVWDNPILWREVCTWAYGRRVLIIRLVYLMSAAMLVLALVYLLDPADRNQSANSMVPTSAMPLAPFFLVSLVIVNALAVTSITNERDGQSLDLLLVTDLTPKELVLGKLFGVFWVTKEMIVVPLFLTGYLLFCNAINVEQWIFLTLGLLVMNVFVAMLGIHCGMTYSNSRSAIGVSLGTVFFLFLGVVICIAMMVSFSGSFQTQLYPFLAFILGGSVGLYVTLGIRNPSNAIFLASLLLPFATFHAITSFLLGHSLSVFLVTVITYGFTTAAMMIPAIGEFDIAMGRTKSASEE